jgi:hypothetical protein
MDLSTIRTKVDTDKYPTLHHFVRDVMLIWKNCKLYNMAGSPIVLEADEMKRRTNHYCAKYDIPLDISRKRKRQEDVPIDDEVFKGEVPFDAKVRICDKVRKLENEDLDRIIELVEAECKAATNSMDEDRMQIRLDDLDKATFDKLSELIDSALAKKK